MLTATLTRLAAERDGVLGVEPGLVIEPDESWTPAAALPAGPELARPTGETVPR